MDLFTKNLRNYSVEKDSKGRKSVSGKSSKATPKKLEKFKENSALKKEKNRKVFIEDSLLDNEEVWNKENKKYFKEKKDSKNKSGATPTTSLNENLNENPSKKLYSFSNNELQRSPCFTKSPEEQSKQKASLNERRISQKLLSEKKNENWVNIVTKDLGEVKEFLNKRSPSTTAKDSSISSITKEKKNTNKLNETDKNFYEINFTSTSSSATSPQCYPIKKAANVMQSSQKGFFKRKLENFSEKFKDLIVELGLKEFNEIKDDVWSIILERMSEADDENGDNKIHVNQDEKILQIRNNLKEKNTSSTSNLSTVTRIEEEGPSSFMKKQKKY